MRVVPVVIALAIGGCRSSENAAPVAPREITGTLVVDGTPLAIGACRPRASGHVFVEIVTPRGVLRFEDKQLFWQPTLASPDRGAPLTCTRLDRSWGGGSRPDGSAYWRGTLAFDCADGARTVTGDLVLDCGQITPAERAQLDANGQGLREQQRRGAP
jgi:hypothetical protein